MIMAAAVRISLGRNILKCFTLNCSSLCLAFIVEKHFTSTVMIGNVQQQFLQQRKNDKLEFGGKNY